MQPRDRLSSKEIQVAILVWEGLTNREIGKIVGTSEQVIKNHLRSAFDKLGVWRPVFSARRTPRRSGPTRLRSKHLCIWRASPFSVHFLRLTLFLAEVPLASAISQVCTSRVQTLQNLSRTRPLGRACNLLNLGPTIDCASRSNGIRIAL